MFFRSSYDSCEDSKTLQRLWDRRYHAGNRVFSHSLVGSFTVTIAEYSLRDHPEVKPNHCTTDTVDIVLSGSGVEKIDGRERAWRPGTILRYHSGCEHFTLRQSQRPRVCKIRSPLPYTAAMESVERSPRARRFHSILALQIALHSAGGDSTSRVTSESLCQEIFGAPAGRQGEPTWGSDVIDYLHSCILGETPSLDCLSRIAGVHRSHFARAFRAWQGCTAGEYLRFLRIRWAATEILTTDAPLSQIALEAGFYDQSHFNRVFKQCLGFTPTECARLSRKHW